MVRQSGDRRGLCRCAQISATPRFGALDRWLRAHFARDEHELPLLKAIKGAILAGKPPESGECRLKRLGAIHEKAEKKFQSYLWVTQHDKCYETRGLNRSDQMLIAEKKFMNGDRDFTEYLNNWEPIKALNGFP